MGGKGVLEWTLKVNMFEAMLYAVLETLKREGNWKGNVHDVRPGLVSTYWLGKVVANTARAGGKSMQKKKETISLVRDWVEEGGILDTKGMGAETAEKYLCRLGKTRKLEDMKKLDDLADCVAQGMAVLKWEENRQMILREGESALSKLEG